MFRIDIVETEQSVLVRLVRSIYKLRELVQFGKRPFCESIQVKLEMHGVNSENSNSERHASSVPGR